MGSGSYNVLILGSAGREHALAWKLLSCKDVNIIHVAPGNAGTALLNPLRVCNVSQLSDTDVPGICEFVVTNNINLVVPGSEATIVTGVADALKKIGVMCFGPVKEAAAIEGSKAFSKNFMRNVGIPTSDFQIFTDYKAAETYVENCRHRIVIKASGLAAGKGVIVPENKQEAILALKQIMIDREFGEAGNEVVVEEFVEGEEISVLAFTDGYSVVLMPPAQDHKRLCDNDKGPNTGGMGAYCPACPAFVTNQSALFEKIKTQVLQRAVDGLRQMHIPYVGVLYAGIMVVRDTQEPFVLEFNARFGDPETQAIMPLLQTDLLSIMLACCNGYLDAIDVTFAQSLSACTVVLANEGYPGTLVSTSRTFSYPPSPKSNLADTAICFLAGAQKTDVSGRVRASGGRVLAVTATGKTLKLAQEAAYAATECYLFEGAHYRRDIGNRGLTVASGNCIHGLESLRYEDAGVSIDRGNTFVEKISSLAAGTKRVGADAEIGGFGGVFDIHAAGYSGPDVVLVASTDGVGTKLRIAIETGEYSGIGCDLVAMSVNDIIVQGAEPLFFLDYYACGTLDVDAAQAVVAGISKACIESNCALIGGETAEMPGMYRGADFDLAGFAVGAVRRSDLLPRKDLIMAGDIVFGMQSSGVHSNGYSLVREIVRRKKLAWNAPAPFLPQSSAATPVNLGKALLEPTRLYVSQVLALSQKKLIKGAAHITGGGLVENIPRILPNELCVELDGRKWPVLPVYEWIYKQGGVSREEMLRTFNSGVGMVVIVSPKDVQEALRTVPELLEIGVVVERVSKETPQVIVTGFMTSNSNE